MRGLKLAAASSAGKNERQTLLSAVEYWLQKMIDTDGMTVKFPTIEEMKGLVLMLQLRIARNSAQTAQKAQNAKSNKKRKRITQTQYFHGYGPEDPLPSGLKRSNFLVFPLTSTLLNQKKLNSSSYTISNRRMKAYRKVFNWKCNNNQLRVDMLKHVESHGGAQPASWTSTSQVGLSM